MTPKFIFEFRGKTANTHISSDAVKKNLSRLFAVSSSDWDKIFCGKARFVKYDLDEFTANLYFDQFKKAGAIGSISAKPRKIETAAKKEELQDNLVNARKRSAFYFRIATFLFVLVYTVDSFFQHFLLDIGTFVYIVPVAFFSVAAYFHTLTKGYPGWFGALAGASIVGLPFLLFVSPKNRTDKTTISIPQAFVALLAVVVLAYFALQKHESNRILENYQQLSKDIRAALGEYPNGIIKDEMEIRDHIKKVQEFIEAAVNIDMDRSLRAGQQSELATLIHNTNASLLKWLNYQRFLFFKGGEEIPEILSKRSVKSLKSDLLNLYKEFYIEHKQYISEYEFYVGSQISNAVHNESAKFRFEILKRANRQTGNTPWGLLNVNKKILGEERNIEEGVYEIYAAKNLNSMSSGKYVAVAFLYTPKRDRFGSDKIELLIIGGNVPEYDFGVISMFEDSRLPASHNSSVRLLLE